MKDRLIVALDVTTAGEALALTKKMRGKVGMFKIASTLFTAAGPDLVRSIVANDGDVFLDLKYHDIPHQVRGAVAMATSLGVSMFNVHCSGGREMMTQAVQGIEDGLGLAQTRPLALGVSVLTSLDDGALGEVGVPGGAEDQVIRLAKLAEDCGLDGLVCSGKEVGLIKEVCPKLVTVIPGVRLIGDDVRDQKRVVTPAEAIRRGADYIVAGGMIINDADPVAAAARHIQDMEKGGVA